MSTVGAPQDGTDLRVRPKVGVRAAGRISRAGAAVLVVAALGACGGDKGPTIPTLPSPAPSPSVAAPTPTPAPSPTAAPPQAFSGTVVDALSGGAIDRAVVEVSGLGTVTTDGAGVFRIETSEPPSVRTVAVRGDAIVPRTTRVTIPGPDLTLTAIPAAFDLAAFDQMFRPGGRLQRWTSAPHLTIQSRVLQFTSVAAEQYVATDRVLSGGEIDLLGADLLWGLPHLTDGLAFASRQHESAETGARVGVARAGQIVVARYAGLQEATGYWGYGRWASDGRGTIRGGIVMLDEGFETSGSPFRRSLRVHELGHALGCSHVTVRQSAMNSSARIEPNEFDRAAARVAFLRLPGNRTPDVDPEGSAGAASTDRLTWRGDH